MLRKLRLAIGRAVVYYARAVYAFSVGINVVTVDTGKLKSSINQQDLQYCRMVKHGKHDDDDDDDDDDDEGDGSGGGGD